MEQITGMFTRDGLVVARNADVFLVTDVTRGDAEWYGSFILSAGSELDGMGDYRLALADGRAGTVLVSRLRVMPYGTCGGFVGRGPLADLGTSTGVGTPGWAAP